MAWLLKTEPDAFSFQDLFASPERTTPWEGVRNYGARNFLREMRVDDAVLIYHSSIPVPGVAGLARVVRESYPDPTQFEPTSSTFDPKATRTAPRWDAVDVQAVAKLPHFVTLASLRQEPALGELRLLQRGNRLSVMPVSRAELEGILRLGQLEPTRELTREPAATQELVGTKPDLKE